MMQMPVMHRSPGVQSPLTGEAQTPHVACGGARRGFHLASRKTLFTPLHQPDAHCMSEPQTAPFALVPTRAHVVVHVAPHTGASLESCAAHARSALSSAGAPGAEVVWRQ